MSSLLQWLALMISPEHLIAYLKTVTDITDVVGTVDGSHVPIVGELDKALGAYMPTKAIIVTAVPGPELQGNTHNLSRGRMDVRGYGKTVAEAWKVANAVYNHFRHRPRAAMNGKTVISFRTDGGGTQGYDPEGDWPFVFLEYIMVMRD